MRTILPPAPGSAPAGSDREQRVRALGRQIAAGQTAAGRGRARALEDRGMELLSRDPALKAALFRLVDVAPACSGPRDVAAHLASLLGEVERPLAPIRSAAGAGHLTGLGVSRPATPSTAHSPRIPYRACGAPRKIEISPESRRAPCRTG